VALDEEDEFHVISSSSPDLKSAPRLYSLSQRSSSIPSRTFSFVCPSAHCTTVAGLVTIKGGDDRYYDNIFVGNGEKLTSDRKGNLKELRWISSFGLWGYDGREQPLFTGGNVYYRGAEPYAQEANPTVLAGTDPKVKLVQQGDRFILQISPGQELKQAGTALVSTGTLGRARTPGLAYENQDGSPLKINTDYFGKRRSAANPTPGPFENPGEGELKLKVW